MGSGLNDDGLSDFSFPMSSLPRRPGPAAPSPTGGEAFAFVSDHRRFWGATIERGVTEMVCYEFYVRDNAGGDKLIGILPERRNKPERTDLESIMNWPSMVFGNSLDLDNVYFVIVSCWDDGKAGSFRREEILAVDRHFINQGSEKG